jgi:hypothetical protein
MELGVLSLSFKGFAPKALRPGKFLLLETSSPSFKVSWGGYIHDYLSLGMKGLDKPLMKILMASGPSPLLDLIKLINLLILKVGFGKLYQWTRSSRFYK